MSLPSSCLALVVALGLVGCGSYSKVAERRPLFRALSGSSTSNESGILRAMRQGRKQPLRALEGYLVAIQTASRQLAQNPHDASALYDYNFALGRVFAAIRDAGLDPWTQPLTVPGSNGGFVLTHRPDPRPQWNPALYEFIPADQFDVRGE